MPLNPINQPTFKAVEGAHRNLTILFKCGLSVLLVVNNHRLLIMIILMSRGNRTGP